MEGLNKVLKYHFKIITAIYGPHNIIWVASGYLRSILLKSFGGVRFVIRHHVWALEFDEIIFLII